MFKSKKEKAEVIEEVTPEEVIVEDVVAEESEPLTIGDVVPEPEVEFSPITEGAKYNGSLIIEKLAEVNADGRLCRLEDGTTAFVPLAVLGEIDA